MTENQEHTIRTAIIKLNLALLDIHRDNQLDMGIHSDHKDQAVDKINEVICMLSRMQTIT